MKMKEKIENALQDSIIYMCHETPELKQSIAIPTPKTDTENFLMMRDMVKSDHSIADIENTRQMLLITKERMVQLHLSLADHYLNAQIIKQEDIR